MIDEIVGGCLAEFGHWIVGVIFFFVAIVVVFTIPGSEHRLFMAYMAFLLFHTSALCILGIGFKMAKRFFAISWFVNLVAFIVVSVIVSQG